MRKVVLGLLLTVTVLCTVLIPVAIAMPASPHCATLTAGVYMALQGTLTLLALLMVVGVVQSHVRRLVGVGRDHIVRMVLGRAPTFIPPPVRLAESAVDDPQVFSLGGVHWRPLAA